MIVANTPNLWGKLKRAGTAAGAALVGFMASGAGAVSRTMQAKAREVVSFADFATPQQAVDSGAKLVRVPVGTHVLTATLVVPPGVSLVGDGIESVIDGTGVANNTAAVSVTGSVAASTTLTGNVAKGAAILPVTSAAGMVAGGWLLVRSTLDNSWSGFRTYRKQSFFQIQSVSGLNITVTELTNTTFESASTTVEVLAPATSHFRNLKILGKTTNDCFGLTITYGLNCLVENVHQVGSKAVGLGCTNSIGTTFRKCSSFLDAAAVDTQYAFAATSSDRTLIDDCDAFGTRHAVAVVGDNQCRRTRVINSRLRATLRAADAHGCGDETTYQNCHIDGGISFGGRGCHYINCEVVAPSNGIIQLAEEVMGGVHEIVGGRYTFLGNSITAGWSPFDLGRGSADITTATREDMTFRYLDAEIVIPSLAGFLIRIQNTSAFKANFDVRGLAINMPSCSAVVRYESSPAGADADFVIVDGVKINASAQVPLFKQGSAATGYATTKMRMQICNAIVTASALTAESTKALTFTYPFEYPKEPRTVYSYKGVRNPSGVATKEIYHSITASSVLSSTVTVTTISGTAFGADFTPQANIQAGIAEL